MPGDELCIDKSTPAEWYLQTNLSKAFRYDAMMGQVHLVSEHRDHAAYQGLHNTHVGTTERLKLWQMQC